MSAHAEADGPQPRGAIVGRMFRTLRGPSSGALTIGIGLISSLIVAAVIGHFVLPGPNTQNLQATLEPPSLAHPFGTDDLGRDVLSRTLAASWLDLAFGIGITVVSVIIGIIVGMISGFLGGWSDRVLMWVVDAVIAFPYLVFVLAVITIVGPGLLGLFLGAVGASWAFYARLTRGEMLVLREKQFIRAARTLGYSPRRVVFRHALPNLVRPIAVYSTSDVVLNILAITGLSYLGLGVPPPTPEWGAIIEEGRPYLLSAWWISALPGVVVVLVGIGFVMIGDALGDRLGVRQEDAVEEVAAA